MPGVCECESRNQQVYIAHPTATECYTDVRFSSGSRRLFGHGIQQIAMNSRDFDSVVKATTATYPSLHIAKQEACRVLRFTPSYPSYPAFHSHSLQSSSRRSMYTQQDKSGEELSAAVDAPPAVLSELTYLLRYASCLLPVTLVCPLSREQQVFTSHRSPEMGSRQSTLTFLQAATDARVLFNFVLTGMMGFGIRGLLCF